MLAHLFNWLTISTAVLAHSITSAHELQHWVKVASDRLKAASKGIQSPFLILVLCLRAIRSLSWWWWWWWCSWVFSLLANSNVDEQAQQEGSKKGATGHPVALSMNRVRVERLRRNTNTLTEAILKLSAWPELWARGSDGLICGGTKSSFYLVFLTYLSFYHLSWLIRACLLTTESRELNYILIPLI